MNKLILFILLMTAIPAVNAETQFIKYKNYLIPINVDNGPCEDRIVPSFATVRDSGDARVIVSTDIAGFNGAPPSDPDDIQSLVHMLTFSDQIDIEGIMSGPRRDTSRSNNAQSRARIMSIINAYAEDRRTLVDNYGADFPSADDLRRVVRSGSLQHHAINGADSNTNEAVSHIIKQARCGYFSGDLRPLYLLGWGGAVDIAQAIFNAPDIIPVIRLVTYSFFNNGLFDSITRCNPFRGQTGCSTWEYLRSTPSLWWVDYTAGRLPMANCLSTQINAIERGGALGSQIVGSYEPPQINEPCREVGPSNNRQIPWFKLGDSWTLMFTHNTASQRDNPHLGTVFGRYFRPDPIRRPTYWQLREESLSQEDGFQGLSRIYSDWEARAGNL